MRRIRSLTQTTCTGLAIVFVVVVLRHGVEATSTLDWPHDPDHLRDIAHAQNIAEGRLLDDPYLAGEWAWYNPLVPAITAGVATLTGQPVPVVHARFYAFLNVTAPLAFFLLLAAIAGPRAAVIGLAIYLFVVEDETWMWGTLFSAPLRGQLCAGAVLSDPGRLVGGCQIPIGPVVRGNRRAVGGDRAGPHRAGRARRRRDRHRRPVARVAVPAVRAFT